MSNILSFIQWLYEHPQALKRRFLPTVIAIISLIVYQWLGIDQYFEEFARPWIMAGALALISGLWAYASIVLPHDKRFFKRTERLISEMCYQKAEELLTRRHFFMGKAGDVNRKILLVRLLNDKDDLATGYDLIRDIERLALLPKELQKLRVAKAKLLLDSGNYERFEEEMALVNVSDLRNTDYYNLYFLLQSRKVEINGDYPKAKRILEKSLSTASSDVERIVSYNNLARLEDRSGHLNIALSYYEKAWELLQNVHKPELYKSIGHNIIILYTQDGKPNKAREILSEIETRIDKKNPEQYLLFLNEQIILARQLEDRVLLESSYEKLDTDVISRINEHKRFMIKVSELRMRLSDGFSFQKHFERLILEQLPAQQLTKDERIRVYRELWIACTQGMSQLPDKILNKAMPLIINELFALEPYVDQKIRSISPELPVLRVYWLGNKLAIIKVKLADEQKQHGYSNLWQQSISQLFRLLEEKCSLWAERKNVEEEIDALIGFVDEYRSYAPAIKLTLRESLQQSALDKLNRLEKTLSQGWPYPGRAHYAISLAYLHWILTGDVKTSKYWIERFEEQKISLSHHMGWLRCWYEEVKKAIASSN
ncbi:MAG: tetratricopeptide repeat protein [Chlorobiales bacterium]|nr:tetratricopeptide repeat protein [Chlorobiales bacterium]